MTNANIINIKQFSDCGHVVFLYEITHPFYSEPRYVFIDEVLIPKEKDNGYDFEFNASYISKVYDDKDKAESAFTKLAYAYLTAGHCIMSNDEYEDATAIPVSSDLYEKYMDSIIDKIVTITDISVINKDNLNDFGSGFFIAFNLKFKINGIKFTAEAYVAYGDYANGKDDNVSIIIAREEKVDRIVACIDNTFSLYDDNDDEDEEKFIVEGDNNITTIDMCAYSTAIKYGIPSLGVNLKSLGKFITNRIYKEINDIISKVDQKA